MDYLENIWRFETASLVITMDALDDYDTDLSWDETGEVTKSLESGELVAFTARAKVYCSLTGETLAVDYLGGCIYKSYSDFNDHIACAKQTREERAKGSKAIVGSYFADMIGNVCTEARNTIQERASQYALLTVNGEMK